MGTLEVLHLFLIILNYAVEFDVGVVEAALQVVESTLELCYGLFTYLPLPLNYDTLIDVSLL